MGWKVYVWKWKSHIDQLFHSENQPLTFWDFRDKQTTRCSIETALLIQRLTEYCSKHWKSAVNKIETRVSALMTKDIC